MAVVAGVVQEDFFAQARAVDVEVDFGGGNVFVPQHLLDCTQIGTAFEQVSGKRVAQRVWADGFAYPGKLAQFFHNIEHHHPRQSATAAVEEERIVAARFRGDRIAHFGYVFGDAVESDGRNRHNALLVALADNRHKALLGVDVRHLQPYKFAHTETAAIERLDDGAVAHALGLRGVDDSHHAVDFVDCEHGGELAPESGRLDEARRVGFDISLHFQEFIEALYARNDTSLRAGVDTHVVQRTDELV